MDAMKYSMEADKYRSAYMPPSSLAMSMYSDPKYLDSTAKSYLDRGYLDSTSALTKAYFENSKMYMDSKGYGSESANPSQPRSSPNYDVSKMYETNSRTPPVSESPETNVKSERPDPSTSSSTSSTSTSSAAASPGGLPSYYSQQSSHVPPGLIPMPQYSQHYHQANASGGSEFRRPLTVIF